MSIAISTVENNVKKPIAQVIFAHGAGADMNHEFMSEITLLLNNANINVLRFNFPYMDKRIILGKRFPPDRMPKLIECYKHVIQNSLGNDTIGNFLSTELPLFIGGKSMGSRVAATLASDADIAPLIDGVFCFGYPFHPANKTDKLRLAPLQDTCKPIFIAQGERDTLGSQKEISQYNLSALCQCFFLIDGDHSLKPRVKSGFTHRQHKENTVKALLNFILSKSANKSK